MGDTQTAALINQTYERADAFLFGRRTYEMLASSWGPCTAEDVPGWEPVLRALRTRPTYVVTSPFTDLVCSGTTV